MKETSWTSTKDWDFTQMNCQMLMSSMNPVAVSSIVHSSYFGIVYILILCLCIHFDTFFFSSTHCFLIQNHDSSHKYQRYLGEPGMFSFKIPLKLSTFGSKLTVQDHGLDRKNTQKAARTGTSQKTMVKASMAFLLFRPQKKNPHINQLTQ